MPRHTNPWSSYRPATLTDIISSISIRRPSISGYEDLKRNVRIPSTQPLTFPLSSSSPGQRETDNDSIPQIQVIWLGHASVYLRLPLCRTGSGSSPGGQRGKEWLGLLFDPIFSKRCSPISFVGPERRLKPPCSIEKLPEVDLVLISHDHYDHLDKKTIRDIERYHSRDPMHAVQYFVPAGLKRTLERFNIPSSRICELAWWEEVTIPYPTVTSKRTQRPAQPPAGILLAGSRQDNEAPMSSPVPSVFQTVHMSASSPDKRPGSEVTLSAADFRHKPPVITATHDRDDNLSSIRSSPISQEKGGWLDPPSPLAIAEGRQTPIDEQPPNVLRISCTPAQHNSGRAPFRKNKTLWCSWYLIYTRSDGEEFRCFFGVDTGYRSVGCTEVCPAFREIRERYGSPDLAFLPIAHGSILPYITSILPQVKLDSYKLTSSIHCSPADALDLQRDLGARMMMPIHYGTWTTERGAKEMSPEIEMACQVAGIRYQWNVDPNVDMDLKDRRAPQPPELASSSTLSHLPEVARDQRANIRKGVLVTDVGAVILISASAD